MPAENVVETDVLVIGGGIAGCFTAIKASEQGVTVTLVDKGYIGRSGQTPYATGFMVFNPGWGHNLDAWMDYVNTTGEYVNNREWAEITMKESYARYQDLLSWGARFQKGEDGEPVRRTMFRGVTEALFFEDHTFMQVLRKQVIKSGVKVMDRIMVTELLKQDGRIAGAVGFPLESNDLYIFKARATVLCVGACGLKPAGYPPLTQLTGDGEAMAYRAGAEITGKEFVDTHFTRADDPGLIGRRKPPTGRRGLTPGHRGPFTRLVNAEGNEIPDRPLGASTYPFTYLALEFEAHAGRAPIFEDSGSGDVTPVVGGAALGMSLRKADGIWPADGNCAASLPGLYAAGDALGDMQNGAAYAVGGSSLAGSSVTGTRAGMSAASYARQVEKPAIDKAELKRAREFVYMPAERRGGFSPRWVTQVLQNTMMPYFILYIKHAERLQAALTLVEFLKDHLVPGMFARDPHELRLAHETSSMVLNTEMRLRSSLFRTESRGNHYREDYPRRDDPNWLAWIKLKKEDGRMKLSRVPIPREWWPDLAIPYEQRYPFRFPGE